MRPAHFTRPFLAVAVLALSASCGTNAHVTRANQPGGQIALQKTPESPQPTADAQGEVVAEKQSGEQATPGSEPAAGAAGAPGAAGKDGSAGKDAAPGAVSSSMTSTTKDSKEVRESSTAGKEANGAGAATGGNGANGGNANDSQTSKDGQTDVVSSEGTANDGAGGGSNDGEVVEKQEGGQETAEKQVVVVKGEDGRDGKDGKSACRVETQSDRMYVATAPKTMKELEAFASKRPLPYKSTKAHKMSLLGAGQSNKVGYTENAQTVFSIEVALPAATAIKSIKRADLILDLGKTKIDGQDDTEVLCFLDERLCSGKVFGLKSWLGNINEQFFTAATYKSPVNTAFSDSLVDSANKKAAGKTVWENSRMTLSLTDLLHGSKYAGDVSGFLYLGAAEVSTPYTRTLNLVVADDTFLKDAKLVLTYEEDTCISAKVLE